MSVLKLQYCTENEDSCTLGYTYVITCFECPELTPLLSLFSGYIRRRSRVHAIWPSSRSVLDVRQGMRKKMAYQKVSYHTWPDLLTPISSDSPPRLLGSCLLIHKTDARPPQFRHPSCQTAEFRNGADRGQHVAEYPSPARHVLSSPSHSAALRGENCNATLSYALMRCKWTTLVCFMTVSVTMPLDCRLQREVPSG